MVGQPASDTNEQFEAADYFHPEYLEEFEETVGSEKQKGTQKKVETFEQNKSKQLKALLTFS